MKTLILKESTWRCGDYASDFKNRRGIGSTLLKNEEGYMCCLGQFTGQLKKGVKIFDLSSPMGTNKVIPFLTKEIGKRKKEIVNTNLSKKAMTINDKWGTTVEQKVEKLTKLFAEEGIKIIFKRSRKKKQNEEN